MTANDNAYRRLQEEMQASIPPGIWEQAQELFNQDMEEVEREVRERLARGELVPPPALNAESGIPASSAPKAKRLHTNYI